MNTKKIAVLEKAIGMLENGFEYNWCSGSKCNCGVVLQAVGVIGYGSYRAAIHNAKDACPITGLSFGEIQKAFIEIGFTRKDILELEWLGNVDVLKRIGEEYFTYTYEPDVTHTYIRKSEGWKDKPTLLKYLRAWVSILKEQDAQAKELITNN